MKTLYLVREEYQSLDSPPKVRPVFANDHYIAARIYADNEVDGWTNEVFLEVQEYAIDEKELPSLVDTYRLFLKRSSNKRWDFLNQNAGNQ